MITNSKKVLGVVLARSGSKGVPDKNIKIFNGKPLLAWSILAGIASNSIDDIVLSTDSIEYANIGKSYGALVPFIRSVEYAKDDSSSVDAIIDAIDELAKLGHKYEYVFLLEPTSPLREPTDIDNAFDLLNNKDVKSVVSVCKAEAFHPSFMFHINNKNYLQPLGGKQPTDLRRQSLKEIYYLEGSIYCSSIEYLRLTKTFYHNLTFPLILPKWKSIEIDDTIDFIIAEAIIKHIKN